MKHPRPDQTPTLRPNRDAGAVFRTAIVFGVLAVALGCVVENNKSAPNPTSPTPTTTTPPTPGTPTTTPTTTTPGTPTPKTNCPDASRAAVSYKSSDPKVCQTMRFQCDSGAELFSNECGCGCIATETTGGTTEPKPASTCPDAAAAGVSYKSKDAKQCASIRFACADGEKAFSSAECGCGCEPKTTAGMCPTAGKDGVSYKSKDAKQCSRMLFKCGAGEEAFSGACGCGCKPKSTAQAPKKNCPEAKTAGVDYKSKDTGFCARARIACGKGTKAFSSECGCGCVPL